MFTRSLTAITLALLVAATPTLAADRQDSRPAGRDTCVRNPQGACLLIRVQGGAAISDHGADAGDAYDLHGNPVDRFDNVVASPGGRDKPREVFATPVGVRF